MSEYTLAEAQPRESHNIIFPALTIEFAFYMALVSAAFFIRFFLLDASPLASNEARQAIGALKFVRGNPNIVTGSPLLFTFDAVLFALFGASDFTARIAPAFFGTILVLLPAFFRRDLGRFGALIASVLLALSPSLVFFSRTLDGAIPAVTCALAAMAFAARYMETRNTSDLYPAAGFAALAFLTAPDIWTIALALAIPAFISRQSLASRSNRQPIQLGNQKSFAPILLVIVFIGVATTFLLNRNGISAGFDLLAVWVDNLRLGVSFFDVLRLLMVYEPLLFFFGLTALLDIAFARRRDRALIFNLLGWWFVTAFLLLSFSANNTPTRIVVVVVPLALLAGWNIGMWIERMIDQTRALSTKELFMHETPILAVVVGLMSFLSIVLAELAQRGNILTADVLLRLLGSSRENSEVGVAIFVLLFLGAFAATSVLAVTTLGWTRAKNVGVLFALSLLSLWMVRQMTLLNFPAGRASNPAEWIVTGAASPNVRDLVSDLRDKSRWRANDTHTLAIDADSSLGPLIEWSLRDFTNARFSLRPVIAPNVQAFVLPANAPPPAEGWISQRYQIELTRGGAANNLRSVIFRDVGTVESIDALLWVPKP